MYDVPLLAENGLASMYDVVIVVDTPDDLRVSRLVHHRGMPADDALARIKAQATREERLKGADIVSPNDGDLADLDARAREVWSDLLARRDHH